MSADSVAAEAARHPIHHYFAGQKTRFLEEWRDILQSGHLVHNLVYRDLTVRYKRSVFGALWTLLHPLVLVVVLVLVFSHIFRFDVGHYEIYLLSALLPWTFFAQTVSTAMAATAWNGQLMKRVRVPKSIFALTTTISGLVNLAISYLPLILVMIVRDVPFTRGMFFLPVSVLIFAVFTFGVSLLLSTISVYFVDVREMFGAAITGLMYLAPIVYPLRIVPERFQTIIKANPMYYLIELVRIPIHGGMVPSLNLIGVCVALALTSVLAGWLAFRRLSSGFYPHL